MRINFTGAESREQYTFQTRNVSARQFLIACLMSFGFGELAGSHCAHQFFQLIVAGKAEGDYLPYR